MKVIFACLGNICRSPMAEVMFKKIVAEAGVADQITVDLTGTSNIAEGPPADECPRCKKYGASWVRK